MVARQSRKKYQTTITARIAPSYKRCIEPLKFSSVFCTLSICSLIWMSGRAARNSSITSLTSCASDTSLAPLLRIISKATTGSPFTNATERRSAVASVTCAICSKRTRRPSCNGKSSLPKSAAVLAVAIVRTACSAPPTSPRPPGASC